MRETLKFGESGRTAYIYVQIFHLRIMHNLIFTQTLQIFKPTISGFIFKSRKWSFKPNKQTNIRKYNK